jgi:FecR protein
VRARKDGMVEFSGAMKMKNDYLWDRSGVPDRELQQLERALSQFRGSSEAPAFPAVDGEFDTVRPRGLFSAWRMPRLAAASVLAAGVAAGVAGLYLRAPSMPMVPGWDVAQIEGVPVVGSAAVRGGNAKASLKVGETLVTDGNSRASVQVAEIGELVVDPVSRVRLLETGSNRKRVAVELGTIHAAIWAPPGEFVVDTPSATAVDLGCAYTLTVAEDGSGTLRTKLGWVGFHQNGHDSFIPAGAMCLTKPKQGPGTPYFEDSSEKFRAALHALDFENLDSAERQKALRTVSLQARRRDAFTLWHLMARVSEAERSMVYDRLVALVHAPVGTTREGTLRLDAAMLDRWWNSFDLGDIGVWRFWEQNEPPRVKNSAS